MAWNDENISPSVTQETDAALVALGQKGAIVSDGVVTGNFAAIQCVNDCTFDELSALNSDFGYLVSEGITLSAGTIIYGPFTQISSTGGIYIAYKA